MQHSESLKYLILSLWQHIPKNRRYQFAFLICLMILASISEAFSIGVVIPFLAVLSDPSALYGNIIVKALGIVAPNEMLLFLTITFALSALLAGLMRLALLWVTTKLSFAIGSDFSVKVYRNALYQPYLEHISRNSSEVINSISQKTNTVIYNIIFPILTLISSLVMLTIVVLALFSINPQISLVVSLGFCFLYALVVRVSRKKLGEYSKVIADESTQVIKSLQEGLGGIRDVLLDGTQPLYCQNYKKADNNLRHAQGMAFFISQSPRYIIETFGMVLISILAYNLSENSEGVSKAVPILGALALGAQRLLPVLQGAYSAWSNILAGRFSLKDVLDLIQKENSSIVKAQRPGRLSFNDNFTFKNLSFRYTPDSRFVFEGVNLKINKGSKVGVIGTTGSGKSTLIDILMGLLNPSSGIVEIDGKVINVFNNRRWQSQIAHVPQFIFLADSTISQNIAFGVPVKDIDMDRVRYASRQAQLEDFIKSLPDKYETSIGERGIKLSGGQRQRIGIARALYKDASIIIFDEATSSLDVATERSIMESIDKIDNNITIIIIAHRISTLKNCTQILEVNRNGIKQIGSFAELVNLNAE